METTLNRIEANAVATDDLITASVQVEAAGKADSDGGTKFRGVAYAGGVLKVNSYRWPEGIVVDLAGLATHDSTPIAFDHRTDLSARLGSARATVKGGKLSIEGTIVRGTPEADRAVALLNAGGLSLSIGASPNKIEQIPAGEVVEVNGQRITGPMAVARRSELVEVSAVGVGADRNATAIAANANAANAVAAGSGDADPIKAERARIAGIQAAFDGLGEEGKRRTAALIESGATLENARSEALGLLRANRPSGIAIHSGGTTGADDSRVRAAAWMMHAGSRDAATRCYDTQTLEQAERLQRSAGSMLGMIAEDLRAQGHTVPHSRDDLIKAGFSSDGLSGPLREAISTIALDSFQRASEPWRAYARRVPLSDFKENRVARLAGVFQFQPVAPGGELKHGQLSGEFTSITLGTSGAIVVIDRQTIINDNAGILSDIPRELGYEAARKIGDDLAPLLADAGGDFFTTGNGNYITGATTVLGVDGLGLAIVKLRKQTDTSGRVLNFTPVYLLVPPELEATAQRLLISDEIMAAEDEPTGNPYKGMAKLLVDARLSAYSTTAWYLFAGPDHGAAIVGTLNGADAPVVEEVDPGIDRLGMGYRGYFDHGVALHETRAVVKSKGAT